MYYQSHRHCVNSLINSIQRLVCSLCNIVRLIHEINSSQHLLIQSATLLSPTRPIIHNHLGACTNLYIICLPIKVRHNCLGDVHTCFLQYSDNLKGCTWIPSRMNDNRAAKLGLGMSCCLKNFSFALSQRPGATNFSNDATLDTGSISSMENFVNEDVSKLRKGGNEYMLQTVEFLNIVSPSMLMNAFFQLLILQKCIRHSFN